jgi:hypothetical protein
MDNEVPIIADIIANMIYKIPISLALVEQVHLNKPFIQSDVLYVLSYIPVGIPTGLYIFVLS